uniref:Uncharacterized protein n=1 Tax=Octactis speculum TaxID=3111310 RepID=A0A7S2H5B2_9STRA|mmetsp:Transcript_61516/g.84576  ORF Transcript_61516/g.84576 Transcript_61516/m.84576 type:complete len:101 (+) Transcript_61516:322-624(+)
MQEGAPHAIIHEVRRIIMEGEELVHTRKEAEVQASGMNGTKGATGEDHKSLKTMCSWTPTQQIPWSSAVGWEIRGARRTSDKTVVGHLLPLPPRSSMTTT